MAVTNKEKGVWGLDQVYNKINQGSIWEYSGVTKFLTWGANNYGAAGTNGVARSSPTQLPGDWSKINSTGYARGPLALKTDGTAWAWGRNHMGQLGQNNTTTYSSPIQIGSDTTWGSEFSRCGGNCHWIKTDGTLWSWGYNHIGAGGFNVYGSGWPSYSGQRSSPVQVPGTTWSKVATANQCAMAIKTDGTLWIWGSSQYGQLAQNNLIYYSSPVQIPGTTWSNISWVSQSQSALATKTDGTLWVWGIAQNGVLGLNTSTVSRSSPTQVPGTTWSTVAGGSSHALAIKTDGTLWAWGYGHYGRLGENDQVNRSSPTQVPGTTWSEIAGSASGTIATKTDGTLWGWGNNVYGQLGQNQSTDGQPGTNYSSPVQITGTGWSDPVASHANVFAKRID